MPKKKPKRLRTKWVWKILSDNDSYIKIGLMNKKVNYCDTIRLQSISIHGQGKRQFIDLTMTDDEAILISNGLLHAVTRVIEKRGIKLSRSRIRNG